LAGFLLLVVIVVLLIGFIPLGVYRTAWGPYAGGGGVLVFVVVCTLLGTGRI
jgi:hypothetical protein